MKIRFIKYAVLLSIVAIVSTGCVLSQMAERQGNKAYLQSDYKTALAKYTEAAQDGNANAQYHLAVMYAEGQGTEKDLSRAAGLLEQATAQGHSDAQLMLGLFNIYGDGVPANPAKGAELIKESAVNGNDVGMYYLGNLYAAGLGVQKDIPTALHWMQQAKEAGFPVKEELLTQEGLTALYAN
ncbi:tetratricopeptide repeat protein [Pseudodesulfovibrio sediminis]|uniref:Sel1 repeat family protein n=1 Tax=Pseudodesulfovibrio sediminis TaxID=2810563 RepID=A0ABN6ES79_9BACT|nr:tetratricopeptide repeat protein [Pseudodesulfovibrio sediminis]BCS87748.1 hypothetical protein PSDVSF_09900 [Pseudodesulfovibrio sediminis]